MIADSRIKCMNLIRNQRTCGSRLEDFLNIPPNLAAMSWRKNSMFVSEYIIMASQKAKRDFEISQALDLNCGRGSHTWCLLVCK